MENGIWKMENQSTVRGAALLKAGIDGATL